MKRLDWNSNPTLCSMKSSTWYNVAIGLQSESESESVYQFGNANRAVQFNNSFCAFRQLRQGFWSLCVQMAAISSIIIILT